MGSRILWLLALLLMIVVFIGGPGVHLGLWSPLAGFSLSLRGGFLGGLILAALSLVAIVIIAMSKNKGGMGKSILTLLIGLILASPVIYLISTGGAGIPPIHDITTDMANPPSFITLAGKRGPGANSLDYDSEKLTRMQKAAYADIKPVLTSLGPDKALALALEVAGGMGWEITGLDAAVRRFEATDHSFWFDFADDIVIVITKTETGSRIDLRSVSRVGISDLGVNANRIRDFQKIFMGWN